MPFDASVMLEAHQALVYPLIVRLSRAAYWQNRTPVSRILFMDPNLISKVMQEMGRKGGKKGGKKGAKMRAEALTPEQRSQIAKKAARARWAKARRKH
jgi:hypothetical protein